MAGSVLEGMQRKIIHIDCDCFYAAVEMRDDPTLRSGPLAVGGQPEHRGVIATCNYEARAFGIRSAMPSRQALELCPSLRIIPPDMPRYRRVAQTIRKILQRYTEQIEPVSLDEAYLDVSAARHFQGSATRMAQAIRAAVRKEVGISVSAGVAPNKFLAKIASDWRKPDGLFVIPPEQVMAFVADLPVARLPGVGQVTEARLTALGIQSCAQLQQFDALVLVREFGRYGARLHELAHGVDERPVQARSQRKSVSVEHTFARDLPHLEACLDVLQPLLERLEERLARVGHPAIWKQFIKLKFDNFCQTTMECLSTDASLDRYRDLCTRAWQRQQRPVRLVGVGVRLADIDEQQLTLFAPV